MESKDIEIPDFWGTIRTDYAGLVEILKDEPVVTFYDEHNSEMKAADFLDTYAGGYYILTRMESDILTYEVRHVVEEAPTESLITDTSGAVFETIQ